MILALMLIGHCSSVKPPSSEKMQVKLTDEWVELLREDTAFAFQKTDTTIISLPPILIQRISVDPPITILESSTYSEFSSAKILFTRSSVPPLQNKTPRLLGRFVFLGRTWTQTVIPFSRRSPRGT